MKWQIPYAGETYEFDDARLTASEARLQKRLTDGLSPTQAEGKRLEMDPDAWVAALAVARRRGGMDADEAVRIDFDEFDLMPIFDATRQALEAEQAAAAEPKQPARKARRAPAAPEPVPEPEAAAS